MNSLVRFLLVFVLFSSSAQAEEYSFGKTPPLNAEMVLRQTARAAMVEESGLFWGDILGLREGMSILDLGAGTGQNAYILAQKLNGTGKVFAADVNIEAINYMASEARERKLANLFPVLVQRDGVDPFYLKNKFDLIFAGHVYYYLRDRVNYFKRLKGSLAPGGRLVILDTKDFKEFAPDDVTDVDGVREVLAHEGPQSPFLAYLKESTRQLLVQSLDQGKRGALKRALSEDFNSMVGDGLFLAHFVERGGSLKEGVDLTVKEKEFLESKIRKLTVENGVVTKEGVLDRESLAVTNEHRFSLRMINTILVVQKFRRYLFGGIPPYLPNSSRVWDKECVVELPEAGLTLEKRYDFIPFHVVYVFKQG